MTISIEVEARHVSGRHTITIEVSDLGLVSFADLVSTIEKAIDADAVIVDVAGVGAPVGDMVNEALRERPAVVWFMHKAIYGWEAMLEKIKSGQLSGLPGYVNENKAVGFIATDVGVAP